MKHLIIAALVALLSSPVLAAQGGEGDNTGCNGQGNHNSPCAGTGGQGGNGGNGGQGGAGGTGVGIAGAVAIAGSSSNAAAVALGGAARGGNATASGGSGGQGGRGGSATSRANGGQGGNATVTVQGGGGGVNGNVPSNYTIRNTPDVYAPGISGGTNPCTNSLSGGGAVAGFGLSLGGSWSDQDCERRNLSALLHNQGQTELAQEVLCETTAVRQARMRIGQPCAADRQAPQVAQAPVIPATQRVRPAYCRPGIANSECQ